LTTEEEPEKKEKKKGAFALFKDSAFARRLALRAPESLLAVSAGAIIAMVVITGVKQDPEPAMGAALSNNIFAPSNGLTNLSDHKELSCDDAAEGDKINCRMQKEANMCRVASGDLNEADLEMARIAWKYFENNYNPETGLVNAVNNTRLIMNEEMYGMARDKKDDNIVHPRQEGRLGYEQYAGKIFENVGFSVSTSASYSNKFRSNTDILGIPIAFDSRDPREFFANNYVVTESYAMDAMELGIDDDNRELLNNIYKVQKQRWKETGIVTAISEDNIDRKPYFLYNSIFNAGLKFSTTNSSGVDYDHLKAVSTKAAISMAMLFPDDPYSAVLMATVSSAYDPEGGWYSGVYESGAGYNDVTTANTNGVIMGGLLYKKYGPLFKHCDNCAKPIKIKSELLNKIDNISECRQCETPKKLSLFD